MMPDDDAMSIDHVLTMILGLDTTFCYAFSNWTGDGLDCYVYNPTWVLKANEWCLYTMRPYGDPRDWRLSNRIRYMGKKVRLLCWSYVSLYWSCFLSFFWAGRRHLDQSRTMRRVLRPSVLIAPMVHRPQVSSLLAGLSSTLIAPMGFPWFFKLILLLL